jgi:hypothetical protein
MKSWRSRVAAAAVVTAAAVTIPLTAGSASASWFPTDPDGFHLAGGWREYQWCMDDGQSGLGEYFREYQCRWNPSDGYWELWVR